MTVKACGSCDGSGDCPECDGYTEIENPETGAKEDCPSCAGTGECQDCGGVGEVNE